ncbi:uncharacterized protein LOC123712476 [Pieris brassicae]|uniref:uncharacterized protein LOC123712476 n=1 Tax=Pieris brassicae TaxID=7116 RepID=UPI001E65EC5D|nr:uncharacterized protein LOC123712476 [Pieris brassicae]
MTNIFKKTISKYIQTVGPRNEVDDIFLPALAYQSIFGQQVLDPRWSWRKHYIHQLLNLFLFIYVFLGTLECLKTSDDKDLQAEAYYTIIMIIIFPVKMALFIKSRFTFRALYATVKNILIDVIRRNPTADIKRVLQTGNRIVFSLFCMVIVPVSIYELTTLWNYIAGTRILLSRSTMTLMPMSSPYYEIAWFLHTIFLLEISSTIILDMWFVALIYFLFAAYQGLVSILKIEINMRSDEYAETLTKALREFYYTHLELNKYLLSLIKMYKVSAFIPLCNAAMCICLNLLLMSKEINWRFAPHMLPMFAEIFAYNWFGEQIKTKMNEVKLALLDYEWTSLKPKDRKAYLAIIIFMTKEFGLKTISGKDLSLITMTAVLKITYQTFTVLQTIDA